MEKQAITFDCNGCGETFTNLVDPSNPTADVRCPFCRAQFVADVSRYAKPAMGMNKDASLHKQPLPKRVSNTSKQTHAWFLKHLSLTNVRCLKDLELSFSDHQDAIRHWTLLLGENGTGKTTLLRTIALLTAGSEAFAELMGHPDHWIRTGAQQCEMRISVIDHSGQAQTLTYRMHSGDTLRTLFDNNKRAFTYLDDLLSAPHHPYFVAGLPSLEFDPVGVFL